MTNTTALTIDIDPEQVWSADFRDSTVEVVLHPATDDEPARITAWHRGRDVREGAGGDRAARRHNTPGITSSFRPEKLSSWLAR